MLKETVGKALISALALSTLRSPEATTEVTLLADIALSEAKAEISETDNPDPIVRAPLIESTFAPPPTTALS